MASRNVILTGQRAAGELLGRSDAHVRKLIAEGLLEPVDPAATPQQFRDSDLHKADRERQKRNFYREASQKAHAEKASRLAARYPGTLTTTEAIRRIRTSLKTFLSYVDIGLLRPVYKGGGGKGESRFWPGDVDQAHARAQANLQRIRTCEHLRTPKVERKRKAAIRKRQEAEGLSVSEVVRSNPSHGTPSSGSPNPASRSDILR